MNKFVIAAAFALSLTGRVYAQATATANLSVGAEAGLFVAATPNMASTGSNFGSFFGTNTALTYYMRTSQAGGSGSIQLRVTSDFSPAGGPSVANPPSVQDKLTYTCTAANPGNGGTATPCSGSVTASTATATPVTSFGADARSLASGNSASVSWILTNDPKYKVGSYQATITFTISAF